MTVIVQTKNKDYFRKLDPYAPVIKDMLKHISKTYKFKCPREVIFRPMRKLPDGIAYRTNFAIAGYNLSTGYYISVDMFLVMARSHKYILDVLAHEVAHIAEATKYRRWSHSTMFEEMYAGLKEWLKERDCAKSALKRLTIKKT